MDGVIYITFIYYAYVIWKEKNYHILQNKKLSQMQLLDKIKVLVW
jgi:hypothetical protein